MSDIAIKVENISKLYQIGDTSSGSLRETLSGLFSSSKKKSTEDFWALKDISFEVKKGEAVGIVGKNGAGKSTLLKVLSRITEPTRGRIEINGRVSSLLEVGTGFHPELTGRENVYLNGTILGMSRAEVKAKFDEIVDFSGVEKFLDTPVKRYSSGMKVRLAFAVAAHLEPEILIIDEVLAVGDAEFQKKCLGKMEDVTGEGRTILFVSHNMSAVKNLCSKAIFLKNGEVKQIDITEKVIELYLNATSGTDSTGLVSQAINCLPKDPVFQLYDFRVLQRGINTTQVTNIDPILLEFMYKVKKKTKGLRVYFDLLDSEGNIIIRSFNDEKADAIPIVEEGFYSASAIIPAHLLAPTHYTLVVRATIYNERSCTGSNGLRITLDVHSQSRVNMAYNDTIRSKVLPDIAWNVKLDSLKPESLS
jgi:lipopolysaccharide transport system ATP-binding protein